MNDNEEILMTSEESGEENESYTQKPIKTDKADPEVEGLHNKYRKGYLQIQPNYQRKYVWDSKKASLLIESILMNIPIPMVYFAKTLDDKINVIDGQQRLTSIFSFIDGCFPDKTPFKLTGLKVLTELKGKLFKELSDNLQNKILEYPIHTITFTADSNPELQYEIFSRLNAGSVALNEQELRNCIYRGKFNDFIKELASDKEYLSLLGLSEPHKRMKDVELVLRFISFYRYGYQNYKTSMKFFLNETMRKEAVFSENDAKEIRKAFKQAITNIKSLLVTDSSQGNVFKRYRIDSVSKEGYWEEKMFNVSLYDILMDSMARQDPHDVMQHLDSIREAYIDLVSTNQEFIDSIEKATSNKAAVEKRFILWSTLLSSIIGSNQKDKRCFSRKLKEELYNKDSTCAICGQQINSIDDSAVDHIEQYYLGGKTIPENARLAHRYCNWSRPRKEDK